MEFIENYCRHVEGEWAGQPLVLEKWQREDIVEPLFGWKEADGHRRYRECYVEIPRKNGKSTLGSAIALYLTFADGEPGAKVFSAAADRDQAAIVFDLARQMAEADDELAQRSQRFRRSIVIPGSASSYIVLSADVETKHGKNAHGILFDELHTQPNRRLYDVLKTSTGARRQPLMVMFTTAGYDRHSICWEVHDYALKVRAGLIEAPSFLAVIYAADENDDWTVPKTWRKANPNLGVSVKRGYLEAECARAKEVPAYENTFKRLHLNLWTEQDVRWMPMEKWAECADPVDVAELAGAECFAGLDLSSTTDISAFVLYFPESNAVLPYFWVPKENVELRARRDRVDYGVWIRQGLIEATEGNVVDQGFIRKRIAALGASYRIREIAYDPWNATKLVTELQEDDGFILTECRQGVASLSSPTKELMTLTLGKRLRHGNNAVLNWMMSNVTVKQDHAGNLKPDKAKSTERIDGVVALVMAISRATVSSDGTSVYEERGILTV